MRELNPLNKTRFVLEIKDRKLKFAIQGFTLPTLTADGPKARVTSNKFGSLPPDTIDIGMLNCRYLCDSLFEVYNELYDWMEFAIREQVRDNITIHVLDSKCVKIIYSFIFEDAYPSTLDGPEMEYTEDSITPCISSVMFSYRKFRKEKVLNS